MNTRKYIEHSGVVVSVSDSSIGVEIESRSACSGCSARSLCSASEQKRKLVEVSRRADTPECAVGQRVVLLGALSGGFRAVLIAYVVPLLLLVSVLLSCSVCGLADSVAGILSLSILIPYFAVVYLLRKRLSNTFIFKIKT